MSLDANIATADTAVQNDYNFLIPFFSQGKRLHVKRPAIFILTEFALVSVECEAAVTHFLCSVHFRACDSAGLWLPICLEDCEALSSTCGMSLFLLLSFVGDQTVKASGQCFLL